ncbi:GAF domain-containing protein [Paenibacillus antibioticophila]|uniref:GAF domain-containing protein n=1 Tax=Paenibacillus antibioticophila TaxID=1274374 RepID=UPI001BB3EEFE|nr:GAF domain-containing protein [Paenibacillus antibioticophila]
MTREDDQSLTIQQQIQQELQQLKSELALDFVAVALADANYRDIYWKIALGAKSERYRKITVRMGRGMAGKVMQTKLPHIVTSYPEEVRDEMLEYPIFLVEAIRSAVGVSVDSKRPEQKQSYGVLLVGQRQERVFREQEIARVEQSAAVLAVLYDSAVVLEPVRELEQAEHTHLKSPLLQLLREFRAEGITCELLDQRITRLSHTRQQQIGEILDLLVHHSMRSIHQAGVTMEQDESGHTRIEFQCVGGEPLSQDLFNPVNDLLISLKCDLEITVEAERQSVRFTIPTRLLLDEQIWNP